MFFNNSKNLNESFNKSYYVIIVFIFFYLIHYVLLGYFTLRVEDLLDIEIVYNKIISNYYKFGKELSFDLLLNGNINFLSLRRLYQPNIFLYYFFGTETAYIINDIIVRFFSFLFFRKFISLIIKDRSITNVSSLIYCFSIQNTVYGFGISTIFYIAYLSQKNALKISSVLILIYLAANSDLAYDFYIPLISFLLFFLIKNQKKINYKFFAILSAIYLLVLIIFNFNLILMYLSEPVSNRSSRVWDPVPYLQITILYIKNFFHINTLDLNDPYKIFRDIPFIFYHTIPLMMILFINNQVKNKSIFIFSTIILIHLFMKTEAGLYLRSLSNLTEQLRITILFKYTFIFSPIFFAIFLNKFKNSIFIKPYILIVLFLFLISTPGPIFIMKKVNYSNLNSENKMIFKNLLSERKFFKAIQFLNNNANRDSTNKYHRRSFKGYYNANDYEYIKKIIGNQTAMSLSGPNYSIDPMKAVYFGLKTIDGYYLYYSQEYKNKFLKIIEEEYKNYPKKFKYYKNWGQRIYISTFDTNNIKINFNILKEMNVKFIISKEILNDNRLKKICNNCGLGKLNLYEIK